MHGMTLEFEHMKRVEEMDAVEFRRFARCRERSFDWIEELLAPIPVAVTG